ncbi:sodium/proline symporter [bacterium]|nr:sodium/proline symporter [bacterium]
MDSNGVIQVANSQIALWAFIGYLVIITMIGVLTSRFSSAGVSEYFLAGRKMNKWVVALSAVVSGRSAWLLIGFTGMAYAQGLSAMWAAVGYITVEFFLFWFYARRLRSFSEEHDCLTVPDFFAARFNDKKGTLRLLLSLIIIVFLTAYVSAQFVGGGKTFASSFGVTPTMGMLITAAIVLLYTLLGGFLAVSLTDFLQAMFMIFALLVLPIVAIAHEGGWGPVAAQLRMDDPSLLTTFGSLGFGGVIGFLAIGLGSPGNPHIIVRYMSIKRVDDLKFSALIGTFWNVMMALGALLIGLVGRAYTPVAATVDQEFLFPALAAEHLHPVLFGMVIASIFAAIMSTADSQLLVAASSVVVDIYQKVMKRDAVIPQRRLVLISRFTVFVLVVLAIAFGLAAEKLVFWLVLFAWAGLGAAIGPTSILALFWKRTTRQGVIAGVIAGTVTTIIWYYTPALKGALYELVPAFLIGALVTWAVSLATSQPDPRN